MKFLILSHFGVNTHYTRQESEISRVRGLSLYYLKTLNFLDEEIKETFTNYV